MNPWEKYDQPPRRWQAEAYPIAMACIRARERAIIQACTGAGKSRLIEAVCLTIAHTLQPGYRIVVTVPTRALVEQTAKGLRKVLGRGAVGRWFTSAREDGVVIVACLDSLGTLNDHMIAMGFRCAFWLADEVHRTATEEVQEQIKILAPVTRLGVTATPYRSVETEALIGWTRIAYRYTIDDAVADGVLVPAIFVAPSERYDDPTDATIAMVTESGIEGPGIVSATTIPDAEECAAKMTAAGIPAEAIHSKMSKKARASAIERLHRGELRCLVHVALLVEGVDFPWLRWLAMRRPRKAAVGIVQEVGRVLRTISEVDAWGPKTSATIFLPHPTPVLDSIARDPAISEDPSLALRKLREAEEEETAEPRVEIDNAPPPVEAVGDVVGYVERLLQHIVDGGIPVRGSRDPGVWRVLAPSVGQVRILREIESDKRKSGFKYLPGEHRDAIRTCLRRPEVLTAGAVSDLITVALSLRSYSGAHYAEHRDWWAGYRGELPEVPVGSCDLVGNRKRRKRKDTGLS